MDEYEPDEYELEGHQPRSVPWFGTASMTFGGLAFGIAFLSCLVAFASPPRGRGDYGAGAMMAALIAVAITAVPAFGSVVSGFIALVRGERPLWLLIPGLLWLGPVLLCVWVALNFVLCRLAT